MPVPSSPRLPLVLLRSKVLFPGSVETLELGHRENLRAVERAGGERLIAAPIVERGELIETERLSPIGTVCEVIDQLRRPGGGVRLVFRGRERVHLDRLRREAEGFYSADYHRAPSSFQEDFVGELAARGQEAMALARALAQASILPTELPEVLRLNAEDPDRLADLAAEVLPLAHADRVRLLGILEVAGRLSALNEWLRSRLARTPMVPGESGARVRSEATDQSLQAVRAELVDADPHELEARELEDRLALTPLSSEARRLARRELAIFRRTPTASRDVAQIRNWLDWMLELPWERDPVPKSAGAEDFDRVAETLEHSHAGLQDVKTRVIEFLAVRHLRRRPGGTVLCLVGPPGTGKSSMGRAVAQALGRKFVHVPVGAIAEEVELRGYTHRQEGAVPGAILDGIHRSGSASPVILIDEIDKLQLGPSGTAGGALLEILDPEQNAEFLDHFLGVPFDLSRCLFLATANDTASIPEAILDRMELIEFSGYTEGEKLAIAKNHLLPRARAAAGVRSNQLSLSPASLRAVVTGYTEEAGVRQLQRLCNSLARKAAVEVVRGKDGLKIRKADLFDLLGPSIAVEDLHPTRPAVGVAMGLAYTSVGGSLLPIEALAVAGSGRTILTGQLGDVLRESVQTALTFVRTQFADFGLKPDTLDQLDLHLHFPSGATPKDGPSAGVAIAAALVSLLVQVPVRHDVAMTGEISLHGNVLPVGGIREKLLAAVRAGITEVLVPARNDEEVLRLPADIRQNLTIHLIGHVRQAFELALARTRSKGRAPRGGGRRGRRSARRAAQPEDPPPTP